jgi:phosphate transport system substrate-binding protein
MGIRCYNKINNYPVNPIFMEKTNYAIKIAFIICLVAFVSGCGQKNSAKTEVNSVSSRLDIKGSDTLLQMASSMAEAFMEKDREADITVTGGGSGTGIASLLNGEITLADTSRDVKPGEAESAASRDKEFHKLIVARDGLSIIAHSDNPVIRLTMDEVGKIFRGEITNWKEVGGEDAPITLYGRQSTSGTYEFMKDEILRGDYASTIRNLEGNQAVVDAVRADRTGVGYTGIAYAAEAGEDLKIFDIAANKDGEYFSPLVKENIENGDYPITRPLYQMMLDLPAPEGLAARFLEFEVGPEGRIITAESGYFEPNQNDEEFNKALLGAIGGK